jgi:hypothetical protein
MCCGPQAAGGYATVPQVAPIAAPTPPLPNPVGFPPGLLPQVIHVSQTGSCHSWHQKLTWQRHRRRRRRKEALGDSHGPLSRCHSHTLLAYAIRTCSGSAFCAHGISAFLHTCCSLSCL